MAALHNPTEYDVVVASGEKVTAGLLAMTLQNMGLNARSFMGWQLVKASGVHGNARVEAVENAMLDEALSAGTIAVIPGFQSVGSTDQSTMRSPYEPAASITYGENDPPGGRNSVGAGPSRARTPRPHRISRRIVGCGWRSNGGWYGWE